MTTQTSHSTLAPTIEILLVAVVLALSVVLTGITAQDVCAAFAVLLSFICSQIAFDLEEDRSKHATEARTTSPARYKRLYLVKEIWWIVTGFALGSAPLLISTFVFATYPFWRIQIRAAELQFRATRHSLADFRHLKQGTVTFSD